MLCPYWGWQAAARDVCTPFAVVGSVRHWCAHTRRCMLGPGRWRLLWQALACVQLGNELTISWVRLGQ